MEVSDGKEVIRSTTANQNIPEVNSVPRMFYKHAADVQKKDSKRQTPCRATQWAERSNSLPTRVYPAQPKLYRRHFSTSDQEVWILEVCTIQVEKTWGDEMHRSMAFEAF